MQNSPSHEHFVVVTGPDGPKKLAITETPQVLGRAADADLSFPGDRRLSRKHASLYVDGDSMILEDLGSANGTIVNGEKISGRHTLSAGDTALVGGITLRSGKPQTAPTGTAPAPRRTALLMVAGVVAIGAIVALVLLNRPNDQEPSEAGSRSLTTQNHGTGNEPTTEESQEQQDPTPTPGANNTALTESTLPSVDRDFARERDLQLVIMDGDFEQAATLVRSIRDASRKRAAQAMFEGALSDEVTRLKEETDGLLASGRNGDALSTLQNALSKFPATSPARTTLATMILSIPAPKVAPTTAESTDVASANQGASNANPGDADSTSEPEVAPNVPKSVLAVVDEHLDAGEKSLAQWEDEAARSRFAKALESLDQTSRHYRVTRAQRGVRLAQALGVFRNAAIAAFESDPTKLGKITIPNAGRANPYRLDESGLSYSLGVFGDRKKMSWSALPSTVIKRIMERGDFSPEARIAGAMVMSMKGGGGSEVMLARLFKKSPNLKPQIDQAVADLRQYPEIPEGGFTLEGTRWLSPREMARRQLDTQISKACAMVKSDKAEEREVGRAVLESLGDVAAHRYHRALRERRVDLLEVLEKHGDYKSLEALVKNYEEYVGLRGQTLELIFDTEIYPYPYRPPAASQEDFANYQRTQAEIDRLTALVQRSWDNPARVKVSKEFRGVVEELKTVRTWIEGMNLAPLTPDPGWILHLPESEAVTIRTLATSANDRKRIDRSAEVLALNEKSYGPATRNERDQCRVTNAYRLMMGRWAVRLHDPMTRASHDHCNDMSRLGFFSHTSPVEGKRTPYDRMVLQGMDASGVSENIAINSGPEGAHRAWLHSPGHHRNILGSSWRIMGPGNVGRYWCQNFAVADRSNDGKTGKRSEGR